MKINFIIFSVIIATAIFFTFILDQQVNETHRYKTVDDFPIPFLSGDQEKLSTVMGGQDIIIHFWASWCAPCLTEFPDLMYFAEKYRDKVKIIAFAVQDKPEKIEKFINTLSKPLPENVYIAADETWSISKQIFNTHKLPESFYLDKDLNILARHNGSKEDWFKSPWIKDFINKNSE